MRTIACVSCAGDGTLHVLELGNKGRLRPLQQLALGGTLMPMAASPDRRRLYVARRSPPLAVATLAIDRTSGLLERLGETPLPASMAYLATDGSGRWLLAASYPGHLVSVSPIGEDGIVQPVQHIVPDLPHAHCVRLRADNQVAFVAALGADEVRPFRFDAASGRLEPQPPVPFPKGSGPRHIELHPALPVAYVLDELDGRLHVFDVSDEGLRARQCIETRVHDAVAPTSAADVRVTPDGAFVFTSERTDSTVTGFRVDATSGELSLVGHWSTQRQPRAMAITPGTPDGRFLLAAGQLSNRVGVHAIGGDGALAPVGELAVGGRPSWIEVFTTDP